VKASHGILTAPLLWEGTGKDGTIPPGSGHALPPPPCAVFRPGVADGAGFPPRVAVDFALCRSYRDLKTSDEE